MTNYDDLADEPFTPPTVDVQYPPAEIDELEPLTEAEVRRIVREEMAWFADAMQRGESR